MNLCTVCQHNERDAIDQALVAGKAHNGLAKTFGVSRNAIDRHAKHLPAIIALAPQKEAALVAHADDLASQIDTLDSEAVRLQAVAEKGGDTRAAIMALRERTRIAELKAKVAGRIQANQVNVLNLNMDEDTAKRAMAAFMARNRPAELTP